MLLPLAGRPMLDYLLDRIREVEEIEEIHVVTNSRFAPVFRDWAPEDVTCTTTGRRRTRTGSARSRDIAFTIERAGLHGEDLFVVAGDNLIGYSLPDYVAFWREKGGAIAVYEVEDRSLLPHYGVVELDDDDRVVGLEEKPSEPKSNLAATAAYLYRGADVELLDKYFEEECSDAPGTTPSGCTPAPLYGYRFSGEWHDIGDLGQLLDTDNLLRGRAGLPQRAEYSLD